MTKLPQLLLVRWCSSSSSLLLLLLLSGTVCVVVRGEDDDDNDQGFLRGPCRDDDLVECRTHGEAACDYDDDDDDFAQDLSSWMLRHCRRTCRICIDSETRPPKGVVSSSSSSSSSRLLPPLPLPQDPGLGKIPDDASTEVLRVIRATNLYWHWMTNRFATALTRHSCRDQHSLCAFWVWQDYCHSSSSTEYHTFMTDECPLSCQLCDSDGWKGRAFLHFLWEDLPRAYNHGDDNVGVVTRRRNALELLLTTVGLDPSSILLPPGDSPAAVTDNWVEELHTRLVSLIPPVLSQIYPTTQTSTDDLSADDLRLLASWHGIPALNDDDDFSNRGTRERLLAQVLVAYRARGWIVHTMQSVDHYVTRPIELHVGFAIPTREALHAVRDNSDNGNGVVYMGAGTGYWASLLQAVGVDVVAYDLQPPGGGRGGTEDGEDEDNAFFEQAYFGSIQKGACTAVFETNPQLARDRSLLLIWPNDPDPIDNRQFCGDEGRECEGSQDVWDADCLEAYMTAGGQKVIYVGERETNIRGSECGISSTCRFQRILQRRFRLEKVVTLPSWWLNQDDLTIWSRRRMDYSEL